MKRFLILIWCILFHRKRDWTVHFADSKYKICWKCNKVRWKDGTWWYNKEKEVSLSGNYFLGRPKVKSIIFFWHGLAAVFDQYDRQMGEFQSGNHADVKERIIKAGYDWDKLDKTGTCLSRQACDDIRNAINSTIRIE